MTLKARTDSMRSPNWTRDEVILALDLYVRRREKGVTWDGKVPEVVELAHLLRELPIHPNEIRTEKFRSPNSVSLKLSNLSSLDSDYAGGATHTSTIDKEVWQDFEGDSERLRKVAESIRQRYREVSDTAVVSESDSTYSVLCSRSVCRPLHASHPVLAVDGAS